MTMIPEIRNDSGIPTLYVDGKPFFCRSGELHNSAAASLEFMEEKVWPNLKGLHMNSVIAPVYWELIEPKEGQFDFTLVDGLIRQARENEMKLIFLWFGLWKNSESMYVPGWMKKDAKTYFRVKKVNGEPINTISPVCKAAVEKDKTAFAKLMAHIRAVDEQESTVITIQVENEIGVLGTPGDYSEQASALFEGEIPADMAALYGVSGSWREAFGQDADEFFMAYYFAEAVETITAAGRAEYPLPCYVNCWLKQYPWYPGSYPSGGPVDTTRKIWKMKAPSLFTIGPDMYVPYVPDTMAEYATEENPLFIPEVRKDAVTASFCLNAFTGYNAICYSPFGIEELALDPSAIDMPPMEVMIALNIDPAAFDIRNSFACLSQTYQLIENLEPLMLKYRGTDKVHAFLRRNNTDFGAFLQLENYNLAIAYDPIRESAPWASGVVYELEPDKFLLIGMMSALTFMPKNGEKAKIEYVCLEEGHLEQGEWIRERVLNGDERMSLRFGDRPTCLLLEVCKY